MYVQATALGQVVMAVFNFLLVNADGAERMRGQAPQSNMEREAQTLFLSLSISFSLFFFCLSLSLYLCVSVSVCVCGYVCVCVCARACAGVGVVAGAGDVCVCERVFSLCFSVCFSVCVCVCFSLFLCFCVSVSLCVYFSVSLCGRRGGVAIIRANVVSLVENTWHVAGVSGRSYVIVLVSVCGWVHAQLHVWMHTVARRCGNLNDFHGLVCNLMTHVYAWVPLSL